MGILRDFARGTSIHGLGFIVEPKLPKITRFIWTLLFIGAMIYATLELRLAVICKLMISSKNRDTLTRLDFKPFLWQCHG